MIRVIPRVKVLVVGCAVAVLLAGCGTGPPRAGSAAIVGDRVIPVAEVQQELNWLLDHAPQVRRKRDSLGMVSRDIVRGRVIHELVGVAAQRLGLHPDRSQAAELIEAAGGPQAAARSVGVGVHRVRQLAMDQVLLKQLAKHYIGRLSVSFVGTVITQENPKATAEQQAVHLAHRVASHPQRAAELFNSVGQPIRKQNFRLREALRKSPALAISAVFGARPGTVIAIRPSRRSTGWLVARIAERTVADHDSATRQQASAGMLHRIGVRMLQPVADELGVRINPRYGVWDPTAMRVFPGQERVSGHQVPSRTVRS